MHDPTTSQHPCTSTLTVWNKIAQINVVLAYFLPAKQGKYTGLIEIFRKHACFH